MQCPACKADNPSGVVPCPKCASPNTMIIRDPDAPSDPNTDTFEVARTADRDSFNYDRPTSRQDSLLVPGMSAAGNTMTGSGTGTSVSAAAADVGVQAGARIGSFISKRYELLGLLGKGGMGLVYRAKDHELDEEVAIKLLQPEYTSELSEIERLKREIVTARRITHPNVIRIHEFGMDEGTGEAFISMEVLPGGSLEEELRRGPLALNRAMNIAIGLCEGLGSAHEQGIIHRDLKPENVLFAADGRAKLVDFGLARSAGSTQHTVWGVTGTPRYMSPEQSVGGPATPRTDVYSMGVLLFQIFTGQFPFDGKNIEELATKHAEDPPPKPRSVRKDVPSRVETLILKALEKDPQKRWRNANDMATELRAMKETSNPGAPRPDAEKPASNGRSQDPTLVIRSDVVDDDGSTLIGVGVSRPPPVRARELGAGREPSSGGAKAPATEPRREPSQSGRAPHEPVRREPSFSGRPTVPPIRPSIQGPPTEPRRAVGSNSNRLLLYGVGLLAIILGIAASYFVPSR